MAVTPPATVTPLGPRPLPPPEGHLQTQPSDNDRSSSELRALDCNLASLCDHIQMEGFHSGVFSDVVVQAMGCTYLLHRLILSRSSYFRNMLHGPWKEAAAPTLVLQIDDPNVNSEAITISLAYLYGHHPKLNDSNAFQVLAAASFLDLQDLCAICTDFIISELWTSNFLAYQIFAESQDYGIHGERVRNACWGYLCQSGTMELREVLPKLSCQTLHTLLTSDELWVPNEEKRFELALFTLLAKSALSEADGSEQETPDSDLGMTALDSCLQKQRNLNDDYHGKQHLEMEMQQVSLQDNLEHKSAQNILVELEDCPVDFHADALFSHPLPLTQPSAPQALLDPSFPLKLKQSATSSPAADSTLNRDSCPFVELQNRSESNRMPGSQVAVEGPSGDSSCYQLSNNMWSSVDQTTEFSSVSHSNNVANPSDWGRCNLPSLWGGRIVGRRQVKSVKSNCGVRSEEYDTFHNVFEGGSLLYCNMSFEALLNVRKQLEELGFPCRAVNDGLWLQMLLCQRVQAIAADTCKNCCLTSNLCACRQPYGYTTGGTTIYYHRPDHDRNNAPGSINNVYIADAQAEGHGISLPVRVHVRGPIDGLAGIGRGTVYSPGPAWPPTRYVFSRVPFGFGNRNGQQLPANDDSEARVDLGGDLSGDGLTALVSLSQGHHAVHPENSERVYEADFPGRLCGTSAHASSGGLPGQLLEWENADGPSIALDLKTPLRDFPPFRFGVEFEDLHRLSDGQVKHSPEVFYAGSLWKVSVQAFNDEDPQGRRTLGLFLHRRKAELTDPLRKVHMYVDSREKVTARYQLICPSKREVMVFGSFKQAGTLLPKAPKGWGWRTALLFDELGDLLQRGALRIAAVIQLV
ncbi:BTB/POZ domain-containing protein [Apostasia shenzhenica]|uniref:BTB/POZ domain-containing protein n=1 Tax=Apostasia shenzhenica TaxID=1088818 RepID=A0A2I0B373_9ASPA|nr:BTB/POZ domain-containing protein [Apostasia shenzhenica]